MIKVLHIITRLDMGGSAQNTLLTCCGLAPKYDTVLVYGASQESGMTSREMALVECGCDNARDHGVRLRKLSSLVRRISPLHDIKAFVELLRIIKREKPDIVHTHTSKAGILGRLAAIVTFVPRVVHTAHGHVFYGHFGSLASKVFLQIEKLFSRFTDRFIALTKGEADDYVRLSVVSRNRLEVIHSGVDTRRFDPKEFVRTEKCAALGLESNHRYIGFVGWLLPIKGPEHLLRAMLSVWPEHPEATLVFVGKGDQENDLRRLAAHHNLNGQVKFLGWRDDVNEIMPLFDIFVLPSLNEGMGRVLVEAMAAAKPIVASRVGGVPDLVTNGQNGILVSPGDEKALAKSIKSLIVDRDLARRMGAAGQKKCHQFSLEGMISRIDTLYQRLDSTNRPA